MKALARHFLAEYYGCDRDLLDDQVALEQALTEAAAAAKTTLISTHLHRFSPQGVSGVALKIDRRADGTRLFEGQAEAVSRSNKLQYLVPNLVEAMFTDFPGNSGETLRISIAPEKTTVRRVD